MFRKDQFISLKFLIDSLIRQGVNEDFKISTDVTVIPRNPDSRIQDYLKELGNVCKEYTLKYPWCSTNQDIWGLNTNFNIQK